MQCRRYIKRNIEITRKSMKTQTNSRIVHFFVNSVDVSNTTCCDLRQISITYFVTTLAPEMRPREEANEEESARHRYHGNHIISISSSSSTSWRWRRWTDAAESASQFIIEQNKFPTELWMIKAATPAANAHMAKHVGHQTTDCWTWLYLLVVGLFGRGSGDDRRRGHNRRLIETYHLFGVHLADGEKS